jgi:hypothetical protein
MNSEIAHNNLLFAIIAKLKQLKDWLKEALVSVTLTPKVPSTLADIRDGPQTSHILPQNGHGNVLKSS